MMNNIDINQLNFIITDWDTGIDSIKAIREQVFIKEQNVPEELEWDQDDVTSIHFLVLHNSNPVATARLTQNGQLGRMSVLYNYRNIGIGNKLLKLILTHAKSTGFTQLFLHAQLNAMKIYSRHGFEPKGEIFIEANIEHQYMQIKL